MPKSHTLHFTADVQEAIASLILQYHVQVNWDESVFELIKKRNPKIVIFELAKKIVNKEGNFKDIPHALKKELGMNQKDAESLADDIKNKIAVLAEMEELQEQVATEKTDAEQEKKEAFAKAKEELMKKIMVKSAPEPIPAPKPQNIGVVKPTITNVEENAKSVQHTQEREVQTPAPEPKPKQSDTYRESIE